MHRESCAGLSLLMPNLVTKADKRENSLAPTVNKSVFGAGVCLCGGPCEAMKLLIPAIVPEANNNYIFY